ncbi:MAG TPA: hypothetical protein DF613_06095 [Lachnospiraceae bacterium]|nr:hypothetical protein [Lachnospiraceae bacterium]
MIEIIYKDENVGTEEKSECTLPKNIRQVGEQHGGIRIYLEDFAYTYLMKTASVNPEKGKLCLLLGSEKEKEGQPVLFIRSAFWLDQMEVDGEHIQLRDAEWSAAAGVMEKNFPDQEILGWSLMLGGCGLEPSPLMTKTHLNHFSGVNRVLFLVDPAEKEEAFFLYDNNALARQGGYYIYYEENRAMQEYMIAHNPLMEGRVGEPADRAVQDFRKAVERRQHSSVKLVGQIVRVAAAACFVFAVAAAVRYVSRTPDRRAAQTAVSQAKETGTGFETGERLYSQPGLSSRTEETPGNEVSDSASAVNGYSVEGSEKQEQEDPAAAPASAEAADSGGKPAEAEGETAMENTVETRADNTAKANAAAADTEVPGATQSDMGTSDDDQASESANADTGDTAAASGQGAYAAYRVQKGDTITSIVKRYYGSLAKIGELCALNHLESEDLIYEGQVILLP